MVGGDNRQEGIRLREEIEKLESLRKVLGDVLTDQKKAELVGQLRSLVDTAGGAAIMGDVHTAGGDFVGHNQTKIITDRVIFLAADQIVRQFRSEPRQVDLNPAIREYLRWLLDRHRYLSLKGMGVSDRVALRLPLLDLYVPLKARLEMPESETWKRDLRLAGRRLSEKGQQALAGRLSEPQPVLDVLQKQDGLIILGDPGAGKTTFLKFLALKLAAGEGEVLGMANRLPILVPLSAYATALSEGDVRLDDFIAGYFHDIGADLPIAEMLAEALRRGAALVLLDGLDEVKELALRHTVVERVVDFYTFQRRAGNKFVLTSRIVGYREVRPAAEGLGECTLVDFEDEEIEAFVAKWSAAVEQQAQGATAVALADAQRARRELLAAIQGNPGVRCLAANPLLLTILALMKRQGVSLPERRVELYEQYVRTLLSTWNRARGLGRPPSHDLDVVQTVRILAPLALWMHEVNPALGLVKREDLRRKLESIYAERGEPNAEAIASQFLSDVHDHAGLLLERGAGEYGFIHLTLEEYLAAVAIALLGSCDIAPIVAYLSQHVGKSAWIEVARLAVGYLGIIQQREEAAGTVVETLLDRAPGKPGEAAVLAGEAVLDAWPCGVPLQCKERTIYALMTAVQGTSVQPALRRQAGLLLGWLGWLPDDVDEFVKVSKGQFLFGKRKAKREIPYRYWIAKYPVTNVQYGRFIQAGGYERQDFWSKDGWAWRQGAWDWRTVYHGKNVKLAREFHDWLSARPAEKRSQPSMWDDPPWNNPIFPVVGISWFEAEAYANWLNTITAVRKPEGYVVRLPTEEEWERAARGTSGQEWPWGNRFRAANANTRAYRTTPLEASGTTSVCTYPQGRSPVGAWDMGGNVTEWTRTRWSGAEPFCIERGGSWALPWVSARCEYRQASVPGGFDWESGFRVVVSQAIAEA